ncbi:MAG: SagB/ThcOx family dehydrogenase [Aquabacterium sp.]|nr:MAG: SagB/ThcOx family dehydrogenase [Aquabacterium sp.]
MDESDTARARAYHQRSKHSLRHYAAGPQTLDWDAQPDPFRRYEGAPRTPLPLPARALPALWPDLGDAQRVPAHPLDRRGIGALLQLGFGLTAWKRHGPDRWALRANPSSGNLHPVEVYLLAAHLPGVADGCHHYDAYAHALEQRLRQPAEPGAPRLWVGLSAIHWREAWKYGERAFRYCQLDTGHALGALRYAAAVLGWQARVVQGLGHDALHALMGTGRDADFGLAEREEPQLLVQVGPRLDGGDVLPCFVGDGSWSGRANRLDPRPMYRWPVIDEVAQATRPLPSPAPARAAPSPSACGTPHAPAGSAAALILQRRSAQRFDRQAVMPLPALARIAAALQPGAGLPWDAWPHAPRVHLMCFVHRVDGLPAGAYLLPRGPGAEDRLAAPLLALHAWTPVPELPGLLRLSAHPALAATLRTLSCHQAIAADACLALSLVAEFDDGLQAAPDGYRRLLQEAGLVGQALYLLAEAEGLRGTGIGCYFDDDVHQLLGLADQRLQVLYHFTIGRPVDDARLASEPPYAHRDPIEGDA